LIKEVDLRVVFRYDSTLFLKGSRFYDAKYAIDAFRREKEAFLSDCGYGIEESQAEQSQGFHRHLQPVEEPS
jgi:hypothetical protein